MKIVWFVLCVILSLTNSSYVVPQGWQSCSNYWYKTCANYCLSRGADLSYCWVDSNWYNGFTGVCDSANDWGSYYSRCYSRSYDRCSGIRSDRHRDRSHHTRYSHGSRRHDRDTGVRTYSHRDEGSHNRRPNRDRSRHNFLQVESKTSLSSPWNWGSYVKCQCATINTGCY